MNLTLSEKIMYNVLHITMLDARKMPSGTATGFIFGFCDDGQRRVNCLVTNRHVLSRCSFIKISFTRKKDDGSPDIGNLVQAIVSTDNATYHPNQDIDLAILPIGPAIGQLNSAGNDPFFTFLVADNIPASDVWGNYCAIENVIMAGYPKGFHDSINSQPIFRSGITATHPAIDFNGRPEFLVDMPCFEGCSGSPIFICDEGIHVDKRTNSIYAGNKLALLGIQYAIPLKQSIGQLASVTTGNTTVPVVPLYINLGFIIKSTELLVFEDIIRAKVNP